MGAAAFRQYPPCIENAPEWNPCRVFAFLTDPVLKKETGCGFSNGSKPGLAVVESLSHGNFLVKIV
jgi:hypothetical protein